MAILELIKLEDFLTEVKASVQEQTPTVFVVSETTHTLTENKKKQLLDFELSLSFKTPTNDIYKCRQSLIKNLEINLGEEIPLGKEVTGERDSIYAKMKDKGIETKEGHWSE